MSQIIRYPCLPDYQHRCVCTVIDVMTRQDCAIEDKPPPKPASKPRGGRPS